MLEKIKHILHYVVEIPAIRHIRHPKRYKTIVFFINYLKKKGCDVKLNDKAIRNKSKIIWELCTCDSAYQSLYFPKNNACLISTQQTAFEAIQKGAIILITHEDYKDYPCLISDNPLDVFAKMGRYFRDLHEGLSVVAVSGSIGKTTIKNMMGEVYKSTFRTTYNPLNANTRMSVGYAVQHIPYNAQKMIQEIHEGNPNETRYISEMLRPDLFVLTPIDKSHFQRFGSSEKIVEEICSITEYMSEEGRVIVNIDEFNRFDLLNGKRVITISEKNTIADYYLKNVKTTENGLTFDIISKEHNVTSNIFLENIYAPHNALCALYAFAAGACEGISLQKIVKGLSNYKTDGVRQNVKRTNDGIVVYADCFNAIGRSMKSAIEGADLITVPGKRIAVLGDIKEGGDISSDMHKEVIQYVVDSKFDYLITLGEEMRNASKEVYDSKKLHIQNCNSLENVTAILRNLMDSGDLVLFKASHSMELDKCINELWPSVFE